MHKLAIGTALFGVFLIVFAVFMWRTVPTENWLTKDLADGARGAIAGSLGLGAFFLGYSYLIYRRD